MAGTSRWPWATARPNTAELKQFKQLQELFQRLSLSEAEGGDPSWFEPQRGSGGFRGITEAHMADEDLSANGGVVCRPCHELRRAVSGYLKYRCTNRKIHYPNDPLNCFFAELLGSLAVLSLLGFGADSDKVLRTVELRLHWLNEVVSSGLFTSGYIPSMKKQTKGHVIMEAQEVFGQMRDDVVAAREHVTLVDTLRQLETSMGSYVLHGLFFAATAFQTKVATAPLKNILEDPKRHAKFLSSSLGRAISTVLQGPARRYAASTSRAGCTSLLMPTSHSMPLCFRDLPAVRSDDRILSDAYRHPEAARTITRFIYMISILARCTDMITHFIGVADAGGKLLVLGAGKEHLQRWVHMSSACLEEATACMEICELLARDKANRIKTRWRGDPTSDPWLRMRAQLSAAEGAQTVLVRTSELLRNRLVTFAQAVQEFDPRQVACEALQEMNDLAQNTDSLYLVLAQELSLPLPPVSAGLIRSTLVAETAVQDRLLESNPCATRATPTVPFSAKLKGAPVMGTATLTDTATPSLHTRQLATSSPIDNRHPRRRLSKSRTRRASSSSSRTSSTSVSHSLSSFASRPR
eukprot:m.227318 g.227318  ORF g.227318 m.227318 type:complete len:581 (+) comp25944_c0_seq2:481-2223(+)